MKSKTKLWLGIGLFVLLFAAVAVAYNLLSEKYKPEVLPEASAPVSGDASEKEKTLAADFTVYDDQGKEKKLSEYFGKPLVLNFWASWCGPCKGEMPHFEKVYGEIGDEVNFLMVNMTDGMRETLETGKAYISDQGFTFPVLYDSEQEAAYTYGVRSLPTTLFIDSEGYVITGAEGQLDEKTLRKGIGMITEEE